MNNGDDIHNLLKTLGHDAGLYQDLAKYNASRAALRRAAMLRPSEPASAPPAPALPLPPPPPAERTQPPRTEPATLSAILHRLASPNETWDHRDHPPLPAAEPHPTGPAAQPARLDRLFGRLVTRPLGPLDR